MSDINFYLTPPHACAYLAGRSANTLFADPALAVTTQLYDTLIDHGFRRSGAHLYRPHCANCDACIPVRVPVSEFQPRRRHKRVWQRNHDLDVRCAGAMYDEEHFQLYQRYLVQRHGNNRMNETTPEHYHELFAAPGIDTRLYEFRHSQRLLAVAVVDHLAQGLSSVYTFFDPAEAARSLGVYAVLWQIREAERIELPWLYLGYWIKECRKMSYKGQYRPLEIYRRNRWLRLTGEEP